MLLLTKDPATTTSQASEAEPPPKRGGRPPTVEEARLRQQAIGYKLRQIFDDVVKEPVPDEFLEILKGAGSSADRRDR